MTEAQRQQRLLGAIWAGAEAAGLREAGPRAAQGLAAYRGNADAVAGRALAAIFPTVAQMLGEEDFAHLAAEHRRAAPPKRGDLGQWGDALPGWIESHPGLAEWPWLADTARLDAAIHHAERAADDTLDVASLTRLGEHDPAQLELVPMAGLALIVSRWPIVAIHAAHRAEGAARDAAFEGVRERLSERVGEDALVARAGWRGVVTLLDGPGSRFTAAILAGQRLDAALGAAGDGFDFAAWLAHAIERCWLKEVRHRAD